MRVIFQPATEKFTTSARILESKVPDSYGLATLSSVRSLLPITASVPYKVVKRYLQDWTERTMVNRPTDISPHCA